jgi:hypothetical protein
MSTVWKSIFKVLLLAAALVSLSLPARAADSLLWSTNKNGVTVDIKDWALPKLLAKISGATGWRVILEPGTSATITAKFQNVSADEALNRLLSNINFAKDSRNGVPHLLVFHTTARAATQVIAPSETGPRDYRIPNELIVRLKRNSTESIDDLAKALGAKVVGRDDRLKLYRLQFADADAANAAATQLGSDSSVGLIDSNYVVDRPNPVVNAPLVGTASTPPTLNVNPVANGVVIGLIDTAVQMQNGFNQYSLPPLSVVGQPNEPADQISHGTSMFETLVLNMAADPGKILPVDVYPVGDSTTTYEVIEGITKAINPGAAALDSSATTQNPGAATPTSANTPGANIINLSLGGTGDSALLQSLIEEGTQKGVLFVAASGNDGGTAPTYPAAYPGVLAITASDPNGQLASYADDGSFVRAMAPGTSIVYLNGQPWEVQGTSTATAFATASIAQIINEQHLSVNQAVTQFIQSHPPPRR